jgi:hypothetical protein
VITIVQPPFVQPNAPYPSPYYLKSFLCARGRRTRVRDHSIALFERIFCRSGLTRVFADAGTVLTGPPDFAPAALRDKRVRIAAERFLSQKELWLNAVDRLIAYLRGRDREFAHLLTLVNGVLPDSPRLDAYLESLPDRLDPDKAPLVASKLLADLAEFIRVTLDGDFSLIRYAESMAVGIARYSDVEKALDGYILRTFYGPLLEEEWTALEAEPPEPGPPERRLLLLTIPFPGCLAGALYCARSARERYGDRVVTLAGGGYVNTELRSIGAPRFFDHIDYLVFDRGYGALEAILERLDAPQVQDGTAADEEIYKTIYRSRRDGLLVGSPDPTSVKSGWEAHAVVDAHGPSWVFPDYAGVDFSRYLCPVDDENPMHRLWTDGRWLKAYLAHGCYWHACAFCDVHLDYIRGYLPVDPGALFAHLVEQARQTGVRGVHLVDEAAPPAPLLRLAELNRAAGLPLSFWGNIRWERAFTPDAAALLAAGGLLGVSAGIEVASEQGFKRLGKGIGLEDVVRACAAFKEAGVLTHAYLIYGYWDQDEQEIMDAAETMRQLFDAGLVDSAFWHKFVLTRHSRVYGEWKQGRHPGFAVQDPAPPRPEAGGDFFADNDLRFTGEARFERWTAPLDRLLAAWMAGDSTAPLPAAFPFAVPRPAIPAGRVAGLLDAYARDRDRDRAAAPATDDRGRAAFIGSRPLVQGSRAGQGTTLRWWWRTEEHTLQLGGGPASAPVPEGGAESLTTLLAELSAGPGKRTTAIHQEISALFGPERTPAVWGALRKGGLVSV